MGSAEGLRLRMLGISKAKLKPIVKPHLMGMKTTIVPLLLSSIESMELLNAEHLREQIVDLILTRTQELSAEQLKFVVKAAVYSHLSWIVFWGSVLGACRLSRRTRLCVCQRHVTCGIKKRYSS